MNIMKISILGLLVLTSLSCGQTNSERQGNQHIVHAQVDTCDSPDANINCCFINMPATLTNTLIITDQDASAERLIISGTFFKADGKTPYPNVILYAYHTDSKGYYSKNGTETGFQKWHGRLHGWCKTDSNGYYEINTIRPARYPDNSMPAHIHMAIKTDNQQVYWISDFVFNDDSLVDNKYLASLTTVGGTGVVDIKKSSENIWTGKRNIVLK